MNLKPRPTWLAGIVAAAAGATVATVMLTGSHPAPAATAPVPIVDRHVDATAAPTPIPTAAPTPEPTAVPTTPQPTPAVLGYVCADGKTVAQPGACATLAPTPKPTADPWAGWELTADGHHRRWCDDHAAYAYDGASCASITMPSQQASQP